MMDNSEEILTQETHAENEEMMEEGSDENNPRVWIMNNILKELRETDFMNLQVEGKQSQLKTKRKRIHDPAFLAYLAQNNNACGIMALTRGFMSMNMEDILIKHEYFFPVEKYDNDYETRIQAIRELLETRDNLSDKEKKESKQKYNEIHFGMGENIVLWPEEASKTRKRPAEEIDWKCLEKEKENIPTVLMVQEHVDIEHLEAFAASNEGQKKIYELNGEHEEENANRDWKDNATGRELITKFLANIKHQKTFITHFRRSVTGEMLVKENLVSAARLYAKKTEGKVYPFSVTQLPRCIKAVAWKNTFQQNDDSSAFQRIIYGKTQLQQAKKLTRELMEDREKVFESIIKGGKFKKWVKHSTLKEAVNAIANGQSITTTENKIGDSGMWLKSWDLAQKAVTNEQCSTDTAKKAITLLKEHFPYKTNKAGERTKRNCRATWRASFTEQFEAQGLIEKYIYFEENDILSGPPIHDDVPCEMFSNREDRLRISKDLTERIKDGIRGYPHILVKSELFKCPEFELKTERFDRTCFMNFDWKAMLKHSTTIIMPRYCVRLRELYPDYTDKWFKKYQIKPLFQFAEKYKFDSPDKGVKMFQQWEKDIDEDKLEELKRDEIELEEIVKDYDLTRIWLCEVYGGVKNYYDGLSNYLKPFEKKFDMVNKKAQDRLLRGLQRHFCVLRGVSQSEMVELIYYKNTDLISKSIHRTFTATKEIFQIRDTILPYLAVEIKEIFDAVKDGVDDSGQAVYQCVRFKPQHYSIGKISSEGKNREKTDNVINWYINHPDRLEKNYAQHLVTADQVRDNKDDLNTFGGLIFDRQWIKEPQEEKALRPFTLHEDDNLSGTIDPLSIKDDLMLFNWHCRNILCGGNLEMYQYDQLMKTNHIRIRRKVGVNSVFISEAGVGKSSVHGCNQNGPGVYFRIFKGYAQMFKAVEECMNHFNAHTKNKLFTVFEDANSNSKRNNQALKAMTTESVKHLTSKGKDTIKVHDNSMNIFHSNVASCLEIEENDRRFAMHSCDNRFSQGSVEKGLVDKEYVGKYNKRLASLQNDKFAYRVYKQHMQWELGDINLHQAPLSALKKAEQEMSKDPVLRYIEDVHKGNVRFLDSRVNDPLWVDQRGSGLYTPAQIEKPPMEESSWLLSKEIFAHFKHYAQQNSVHGDYTSRRRTTGDDGTIPAFAKKMAKLAVDHAHILKWRDTNKGKSYKFIFNRPSIVAHMDERNENRVREIALKNTGLDHNEDVCVYKARKAILSQQGDNPEENQEDKKFFVMRYRLDDVSYTVLEAFDDKGLAQEKTRAAREELIEGGVRIELWARKNWEVIGVE